MYRGSVGTRRRTTTTRKHAGVNDGLCRLTTCFPCLQGHTTPLHWAVLNGNEAVCRLIIEHRADVHAREKVMTGRGRGSVGRAVRVSVDGC